MKEIKKVAAEYIVGLSVEQRIELLGRMERTGIKRACDLRVECLSLQCQKWENVQV